MNPARLPLALLVSIALVAAYPAAARDLSFEQRVAAQRAIERVYHAHQIGESRPFSAAVPVEVLEGKVRRQLRLSVALDRFWHAPVDGEALRAEVERMAAGTRMPDRLAEIFAALENDRFLVEECLARPILAERLARDYFAKSPPQGSKLDWNDWWRSVEPQIQVSETRVVASGLGSLPRPAPRDATESFGVPRQNHLAVWTGSVMIVWGGDSETATLNSGGRYDPATNSWTPTSTFQAPPAASSPSGAWTGSELIVWGGSGVANTFLATGGRYNPVTDTWIATSVSGAPQGRAGHTAVWTGSEFIVWGGVASDSPYLGSGGRYSPLTDTWSALANMRAPSARAGHTAVWTGTEMLIWGGEDGTALSTGGRYDPSSDSWTRLGRRGVPPARFSHEAVWTGGRMIVWGGVDTHRGLQLEWHDTGGQYDPQTDRWIATSMIGAPAARGNFTAVWTGNAMIVWGGNDGSTVHSTGGRFDPATDTWSATSTIAAPQARAQHSAVWTGQLMLVFGGRSGSGFFNDGGRYSPGTDSWTGF